MEDLIPPLPCDFVHQIEQDFPQEAATLLSALDHTEPVVSLRLNIRKCARYKASPSLAYPSLRRSLGAKRDIDLRDAHFSLTIPSGTPACTMYKRLPLWLSPSLRLYSLSVP